MINSCCGERLIYDTGRRHNPKYLYHQWKCLKCKKRYRQKVRLASTKEIIKENK